MFVQFSTATTCAIGTPSAADMNLEDCSVCRLRGWGWRDNGRAPASWDPTIVFTTMGPQTLRIQTREDGLAIGRIVLSPAAFRTTPPER